MSADSAPSAPSSITEISILPVLDLDIRFPTHRNEHPDGNDTAKVCLADDLITVADTLKLADPKRSISRMLTEASSLLTRMSESAYATKGEPTTDMYHWSDMDKRIRKTLNTWLVNVATIGEIAISNHLPGMASSSFPDEAEAEAEEHIQPNSLLRDPVRFDVKYPSESFGGCYVLPSPGPINRFGLDLTEGGEVMKHSTKAAERLVKAYESERMSRTEMEESVRDYLRKKLENTGILIVGSIVDKEPWTNVITLHSQPWSIREAEETAATLKLHSSCSR